MTLADVYLVCFLVGFALSLLSVLTGSSHLHLPHVHVHHGAPHAHAGGRDQDAPEIPDSEFFPCHLACLPSS